MVVPIPHITNASGPLVDAKNILIDKLNELEPEARKSPQYPINDALRGSAILFRAGCHISREDEGSHG